MPCKDHENHEHKELTVVLPSFIRILARASALQSVAVQAVDWQRRKWTAIFIIIFFHSSFFFLIFLLRRVLFS